MTRTFSDLGALLMGVAIATGLAFAGFFLGHAYKSAHLANRYVSVRGLAEREVKATKATWFLGFTQTGDELVQVYEASEKQEDAVRKFLMSKGFSEKEIEPARYTSNDRLEDVFENEKVKRARFAISSSIEIHTTNVDLVDKTSRELKELLAQGIMIDSATPRYVFDGVNALKPELIAEATKNARLAADKFAADSGSRIGTIRQASQGRVSIAARSGGAVDDYGYSSEEKSLWKLVRVITDVDYSLAE